LLGATPYLQRLDILPERLVPLAAGELEKGESC
jgi:hypothetical protein